MNSKRKNKISECCDILDNLRVPINDEIRQTMQGNIPYYGANGIQGYIDKYIFDEDLILLAEDGGNFEEYHTRPIAYKISGKSWVNNHAHILRAKPEFNQDFIFYSLVHKDITKYLNSGTRSKLNKSELEKIEIDFPATKDEEDKIAKILSTADAVIEKTQAVIAKYKAIKQGMLQDLFTRGIDVNTNKLRPRYQDAPELYKESKLGMIPREWYVRELESVCDVRDGTHDSPAYHDKGIPFITSKNLKETGIDFTDINYISKENHIQFSQRSKVENGDILFAMIGTVGNPVIVNANFEFSIKNVALLKFEQSKDLINTYSLQFLKSNQISEQFGRKSEGSVQSFISLTTIRSLLFPIPNLNEQNAIAERFLSIDTTLQTEQTYLQKMQSLKKGLMDDLLCGKVKVSEPLIVTD